MSDGDADQLAAKLDVLIRLVAVGICGDRPQREKIALLDSAGLLPKTIAEILGTTSNTVRVELSNIRKKSKTKGGVRSKGEKRA